MFHPPAALASRFGVLLLGLAVLLLGAAGCRRPAEDKTAPTPFGVPTMREAAAAALPSVVRVRSKPDEQVQDIDGSITFRNVQDFFGRLSGVASEASGVIWSADGTVVTVASAVDPTGKVEVLLPGRLEPIPAAVSGVDPASGVAVIRMEGEDFTPITRGKSRPLMAGDFVLGVGNEPDFPGTVVHGLISGVDRNVALERSPGYESYIQTDIRGTRAMLGGALVNVRGEMVGLLARSVALDPTARSGPTLALPMETLERVVDDLLKNGRVERGFLGVGIVDSDHELARQFGLAYREGAFITNVLPNTAASSLDIQVGDFITSVDGETVRDAAHLQVIIGRRVPGTDVDLAVVRGGKEMHVHAKLGQWDGRYY